MRMTNRATTIWNELQRQHESERRDELAKNVNLEDKVKRLQKNANALQGETIRLEIEIDRLRNKLKSIYQRATLSIPQPIDLKWIAQIAIDAQ